VVHEDTQKETSVRAGILRDGTTDCCRLIHGASDGWPGWYVDRLGGFLLSQSEHPLQADQRGFLEKAAAGIGGGVGVYHKILDRQVRRSSVEEACPRHVFGTVAPDRFVVRENGIAFELSFEEGYSVGLFLDQRENRRRLLDQMAGPGFPVPAGGAAGKELLNTFAYTCAFSVCAAKAGMRATSLDLSRKYLDWGRRNFELNGLDPAANDFIYGDAFNWMKRLAKKGRRFDVIILDPPTFSRSKERGEFRAEKDYGELVGVALPLLNTGGTLLASTNAARYEPEHFRADVRRAVAGAGRGISRELFATQPPDFPAGRSEPAYLKTLWLCVE